MARRRSGRRSLSEKAIRGGLALVVGMLGYGAVTHATANALRSSAAERAYALAPYDARLAAQLAAALSVPGGGEADRARAERLAREALRGDATAVAAVTTLGINSELRKDARSARRLFDYSAALSRRDLPTRLWMIETAVAKGDIPEAVRHYDIALRTSRSAPDLLWPVLAGALSEPAIRNELVRTLGRRPAWSENFIPYVALQAPDTLATARFFAQLRRARVPVAADANAAVISRLVVDRQYDAAWHFYSLGNPGVDRSRSRDPRFTSANPAPSLFDWQAVNENGVTATIERGQSGGIFDFATAPSIGGPVLRQMQSLPPGSYRITGHSIGIDLPAGSPAYWSLTCIDDKALGRIAVPNSSMAEGKFVGDVTVPAGCRVQTLALIVPPTNRISGGSGQIDHVQLEPRR